MGLPEKRPSTHLRGFHERCATSAMRFSPRSRWAEAGRITAAVLVDHIVPLPAGKDDRKSLQPLCQPCYALQIACERQPRNNSIKKLVGGLGEPAGASRARN